ncbi:unnamed protein product, partial [Sphacelaria rigidula]
TGVLGGAGATSNGRAGGARRSSLAASMVAVGLVPPSVAQQLVPPVSTSAVAEGAGTVASGTPEMCGSRQYDFDEGSDASGITDGMDSMPNGNGGAWKGKGKSSDRRAIDGARGAGSGGYGNAGSGGESAGGDVMDMENNQEEGAQGGTQVAAGKSLHAPNVRRGNWAGGASAAPVANSVLPISAAAAAAAAAASPPPTNQHRRWNLKYMKVMGDGAPKSDVCSSCRLHP